MKEGFQPTGTPTRIPPASPSSVVLNEDSSCIPYLFLPSTHPPPLILRQPLPLILSCTSNNNNTADCTNTIQLSLPRSISLSSQLSFSIALPASLCLYYLLPYSVALPLSVCLSECLSSWPFPSVTHCVSLSNSMWVCNYIWRTLVKKRPHGVCHSLTLLSGRDFVVSLSSFIPIFFSAPSRHLLIGALSPAMAKEKKS